MSFYEKEKKKEINFILVFYGFDCWALTKILLHLTNWPITNAFNVIAVWSLDFLDDITRVYIYIELSK